MSFGASCLSQSQAPIEVDGPLILEADRKNDPLLIGASGGYELLQDFRSDTAALILGPICISPISITSGRT